MKGITVTWFGHSCFKIEKNGYRIIIDPYKKGSVPGLNPLKETAECALKTHNHFDHDALDEINLTEGSTSPFTIEEFRSYHDSKKGLLRGKNKIYKISDGEESVVHMGDIGCIPSKKILENIRGCDILLLPVGGTYTVDAKEASKLCDLIAPKVCIPMHYYRDGYGLPNLSDVSKFTALRDKAELTEESSLSTGDIEEEKTVVLVPKYRA